MKITIRKAKPEDIEYVIDLAVEMVGMSISPYRDCLKSQVQEFRRKDLAVLKDINSNNNIGIFIASDEDSNFIGHVIVVSGDIESSTGERQGWIFDISVKEAYWHCGIGKKLMRHAEEFIKNIGLRYIGMGVTASNERAVRFYERLGYKEERKRMIKRL